jgi:hypothetical protein
MEDGEKLSLEQIRALLEVSGEVRFQVQHNRGRQFNQSPSGRLAQNTVELSEAQATIGGNTTRCFFVEQDDVSLHGLSQENCRSLARLEFLHAGEYDVRGRFGADPPWQV